MRWRYLLASLLLGCWSADQKGGGKEAAQFRPSQPGGELKLEPEELNFGFLYTGQTKVLKLKLENQGEGPLYFDSIDFEHVSDFQISYGDDATLELEDLDRDGQAGLAPEVEVELKLSFQPQQRGHQLGALLIKTPEAEQLIPVMGQSAEPSCLSLTPTLLDFGTRPLGQSVSALLQMSPCSNTPLVISAMRLSADSDAAFELIPRITPLRLEEPQELELRFLPRERQQSEAVLEIESNDKLQPLQKIRLRGQGSANLCPEAIFEPIRGRHIGIHPLDGSSSLDPDGLEGQPIRWEWRLERGPEGAMVSENSSGAPDDPETPQAQLSAPTHGAYSLSLIVMDESFSSVEICAAAEQRQYFIIPRDPPARLEIRLSWTTPGLPDPRREALSIMDLHVLRRQGASWRGAEDCYRGHCEMSWGPEEGDPSLSLERPGESIGVQRLEIWNDHPPRPFHLGVHYLQARDPVDGYQFGPSQAHLEIFYLGEPIWEMVGWLEEGQFWELGLLDRGEFQLIDQLYEEIP